MNTSAVSLSTYDLCIAAVLVLFCGILSFAMKLGLQKRLLVASLRTIVQLILIGHILTWFFQSEHHLYLIILVLIMTISAGRAAVTRASRSILHARMMATITLFTVGLATSITVTAAVVGISPWYKPQYLIPLLGMILGNSLTGISLSLDTFLDILDTRRSEVEQDLALGASRWEAAQGPLRESVRRGMIPIINSMSVVGIVSLPGMMTGQILAGADPLEAVKYQIVVMFMLAAAVTLGCVGLTALVYKRLFNEKHQLLSHRIRKTGDTA